MVSSARLPRKTCLNHFQVDTTLICLHNRLRYEWIYDQTNSSGAACIYSNDWNDHLQRYKLEWLASDCILAYFYCKGAKTKGMWHKILEQGAALDQGVERKGCEWLKWICQSRPRKPSSVPLPGRNVAFHWHRYTLLVKWTSAIMMHHLSDANQALPSRELLLEL